MRSALTALITASLVAVSSLTAAPASAAVLTPGGLTCSVNTLLVRVSGTPVSSISAAAGDTMTIQNVSGATLTIGLSGVTNTGGGTIADMAFSTFTVVGFPGTVTFTPTGAGAGPCVSAPPITLTFTGSGGGSSSSAESSFTPAPIVQQFGKAATGTCEATAPESLDWSGVGSGGWGESWAQWMNGGSGGAVCTRTLIYNTAQSRWIVG